MGSLFKMVSKVAVLMFIGQIILAFLLFYLLPKSEGHNNNVSSPKEFNKNGQPIISLNNGDVRGSIKSATDGSQYAQFLGIPYAEPPLGNLRFARPKPYSQSWNKSIRDARKKPPKCLQIHPESEDVIGTEDCLVLNIYVPLKCCGHEIEENCPIMVWFHPGDFLSQDGSPQKFGPQLFMEYKEVVLVSINYRLGPFGFLTTETEEAPGNLGLRDQSLALKWIKNEASNFCGDPNRISIFGSGSGATSAILQMISPLNQGKNLFNGVIAQSGSPVMNSIFEIGNRKKAALALASDVGCKNTEEILKCLKYKADPVTLATVALQPGRNYSNSWVPMIDKDFINDSFIPEKPGQLLKEMKNDYVKAIILGHNTEEGLDKIAPYLQNPQLFKNFTANLPEIMFGSMEGKKILQKNIIKILKRTYIPDGRIYLGNVKYMMKMISDYAYTGPIGITLNMLLEHQSQIRTYYYQYGYSGSQSLCDKQVYYGWRYSIKLQLQNLGLGYNMRNGYGVCRGDEMLAMFIFGEEPPPVDYGPLTSTDKKISKEFVQLWSNFAKTTYPVGEDKTFQWEQAETSQRRFGLMRALPFEMKTDDLYWTRVKVFGNVYKALHSSEMGNFDSQNQDLLKIQDLIKSELHQAPVGSVKRI